MKPSTGFASRVNRFTHEGKLAEKNAHAPGPGSYNAGDPKWGKNSNSSKPNEMVMMNCSNANIGIPTLLK